MGRFGQVRDGIRRAYGLTRDVIRTAQARAQEPDPEPARVVARNHPAARPADPDPVVRPGVPARPAGAGGAAPAGAGGDGPEPPPPLGSTDGPEPADNAVPRSLQVAAAWSWRLIVIGAVAYALLWLSARFMLLVAPMMIALLLAGLLMPAQRALLRAGINRSVAALTVVVGGIAAVGGSLYLVVLQFVEGFDALVENVEEGIGQVEEWLRGSPLDPGNLDPAPTPSPTTTDTPDPTATATPDPGQTQGAGNGKLLENLQEAFSDWVNANQNQLTTAGVTALLGTFQFLTGMVLALVVTFFFLRDGRRIWNFLVGMLPVPARAPMAYAGDGAWRSLSGYVRATVLVALVDAVGIGLGLLILSWVMNFPRGLVLPLAALVFLGGFVPIVGAFVSGTVAVVVGLMTGLEEGPAYGLLQALIVLGIVVVVQQLESNVLQPLIVSRMVRIHPLAVIIAVMAGILLAGIIGALVAVPVVAVLNTVVRRLSRYRREPPEPAALPGVPSPGGAR